MNLKDERIYRMVKKRQQYSANFKAKVALEAIREEGTLSQLSNKYQVNANLISKWKAQVLQGMSRIFSQPCDYADSSKEQHIKELHAKIGELTVERDFLEQVSNRLGLGGGRKW